jgi:hypothetical protein
MTDPTLMVWRQPSAGHYAVNVWMSLECLAPGMQNAEETNLGAEVSGIGGYFQQGGGGGFKQEREQDLLVLPD